MQGHVVPKRFYFFIFGTLLALTALTTAMAYVDLGEWNTIVALVIACCKATLVVLFFMHLRWSTGLMRTVLLSALLWLAILIGLTTTDFFSRNWTPVPEGWESSLQRPPAPRSTVGAVREPPLRPDRVARGGDVERAYEYHTVE